MFIELFSIQYSVTTLYTFSLYIFTCCTCIYFSKLFNLINFSLKNDSVFELFSVKIHGYIYICAESTYVVFLDLLQHAYIYSSSSTSLSFPSNVWSRLQKLSFLATLGLTLANTYIIYIYPLQISILRTVTESSRFGLLKLINFDLSRCFIYI